jgi:spermidine synthase
MRNYIRLETIYPEKLLFGDYTLVHDIKTNDLTPEIMDFYGLNLSEDYEYPSVSLYKLNERLCVMDSGILSEHINKFFMDNASGKILTFGLGLGFIIFPLLNDSTVTSITIVEKNIEIYNTISPFIKQYDTHNKVNIVMGDAFTYHEEITDENFDFIYFDIWSRVKPIIVEEFNQLKPLYQNNSNVIRYCFQDLVDGGVLFK